MNATWTQPLCRACWDLNYPDRVPHRVTFEPEELCCLCGRLTLDGIYTRLDPRTVRFPRTHYNDD